MKYFYVEFETRQIGAIGEFEPRSDVVLAANLAQALERARRAFNASGYETRFPLTVREAPNNRA